MMSRRSRWEHCHMGDPKKESVRSENDEKRAGSSRFIPLFQGEELRRAGQWVGCSET